MSPLLMALILFGLVGAFAVSASRRLRLLKTGSATWESRTDRLRDRLGALFTFAILQRKMAYYPLAGAAHYLIFIGFNVLLVRSIVLFGRGFEPGFNLFFLGPEQPLGVLYNFLKDSVALLVLLGVAVFLHLRLVRREKRMTLKTEGVVILGIIATMMIADLLYDGAGLVLAGRFSSECASPGPGCVQISEVIAPFAKGPAEPHFSFLEPGGSLLSLLLSGLGSGPLVVLAHAGFWTHVTLVLVFLNILPYSKHFHIITAGPNVFLGDLTPAGRLRPLAPSTEALMTQVEKASEGDTIDEARIGYARIEHFSWKDMLDFYTCTECGRCSANCPATLTGKLLSPKHLTLALRDRFYEKDKQTERKAAAALEGSAPVEDGAEEPTQALVPSVVKPEVLWACTTCRACEEQCPVNITYVDKIVQMRRNLVTIRGEFPQELAKPFEGMESNGNPWSFSREDRPAWAEGLEVKTFAEHPATEVLFWVGCAASYDDRAKRIARTTAQLLSTAGVDFAILAEEESCTGDPARRAGNEYLFSMLAETNAATLNGYKEQGGIRRIITTCPHCFNTLKNEYPDFGAKFEVIHHSDYLLGLVAEGKLVPNNAVEGRVAYHDSCYLGRYNGIYDSPRRILERIQGLELVEVSHWNKSQGLCCGAGGAQMWMEEQNKDRVNVKRTLQLLDTGATKVATACPYCMTMVRDGLKNEGREEEVQTYDIVEMLGLACGLRDPKKTEALSN